MVGNERREALFVTAASASRRCPSLPASPQRERAMITHRAGRMQSECPAHAGVAQASLRRGAGRVAGLDRDVCQAQRLMVAMLLRLHGLSPLVFTSKMLPPTWVRKTGADLAELGQSAGEDIQHELGKIGPGQPESALQPQPEPERQILCVRALSAHVQVQSRIHPTPEFGDVLGRTRGSTSCTGTPPPPRPPWQNTRPTWRPEYSAYPHTIDIMTQVRPNPS